MSHLPDPLQPVDFTGATNSTSVTGAFEPVSHLPDPLQPIDFTGASNSAFITGAFEPASCLKCTSHLVQ